MSYSLYRVLARLRFVVEYTRRNTRRLRGSTRPQRAVDTKREPQLNRWLQLVAFESSFVGSPRKRFSLSPGTSNLVPRIFADGIFI